MLVFCRLADRLARFGAWLAVAIMLLLVGHILVEIVLRAFFQSSTFVLDEMGAYAVAAMTFLALGQALNQNALIKVSLLTDRLSAFAQKLVETFALLSTFSVSLFLGFYLWKSLARNWKRGAVSETVAEVPLWIPQSVVMLGLAIFCIQLLAVLIRLWNKKCADAVSNEQEV